MNFIDWFKELTSDEQWFIQEEWRQVPGHEGQYIVSESGKVFRLPHKRIRRSRWGNGGDQNYGFASKMLIPQQDKREGKGYWVVSFKGGIFPIHRLVAMAWHPNPENKPQVNHIDHNKSNNHYSNLEWCTAKENMSHSARAGIFNGQHAKLNIDQVRKIKYEHSGISSIKLAKVYNISSCVIRQIRQGIRWKYV